MPGSPRAFLCPKKQSVPCSQGGMHLFCLCCEQNRSWDKAAILAAFTQWLSVKCVKGTISVSLHCQGRLKMLQAGWDHAGSLALQEEEQLEPRGPKISWQFLRQHKNYINWKQWLYLGKDGSWGELPFKSWNHPALTDKLDFAIYSILSPQPHRYWNRDKEPAAFSATMKYWCSIGLFSRDVCT